MQLFYFQGLFQWNASLKQRIIIYRRQKYVTSQPEIAFLLFGLYLILGMGWGGGVQGVSIRRNNSGKTLYYQAGTGKELVNLICSNTP